MANKKPLVLGSGSDLIEEIQSGDTLSTSDISDSTNKRFITDEQANIICKNYYVGVVDTSPPTFTDHGDGTGTIGACTIAIRDNSNYSGYIREYSVSSDTFSFVDGTQEYIVVSYNSGTPIYEKTDVMPNGSDKSLIYVVWRVGLTLHSVNQDSIGLGLPNKINARFLNTEPYAISSLGGLIISETATPSSRTIIVSSAIVYTGNCPCSVLSFNSSSDNMYKVLSTPSGWTYTLSSQYDNEYYNPDSLGEVALDNNKYKYNLYYRSIGDVKDVFYVESENQYNSAADARVASEAGRSSIPIVLKNHCLFIGRSIIQKGSISGETTPFIRTRGSFSTYVPSHNELPDLQGGASGQYYHLTQEDYNSASNYTSDSDVFGFLNQTETTISFDGTNTFTISPASTTWTYYRSGKRNTITGSKTVVLPGSPVTTGMYFIYIDSDDGTLIQNTSPWTLNDTIVLVATIYFNNSLTPKYVLGEERHTVKISRRDHMIEHYTIGSLYSSGGTLTGPTVASSVNANKTCAVTSVSFFDEDIYQATQAISKGNATSEYFYSILYRTSSTTWAWERSLVPFKYTGAGAIEYDNSGTMTAAGAGGGGATRYVNYYMLACNLNGQESIMWIPGRSAFTSSALAYAETFSSFDITGIPTKDGVAIYQFTWDTNGTGLGLCRLTRTPVRINSNIITSTAITTVAHNSTSGLQGGSTTERYHLTLSEAETVQNSKTFSIAMSIALG